ncbi:MAG: DNA polymerase III subunit delta' [bacterium]|nr:MAG: DNA polymerase III subunit delta' [bacterium]
MLFDQIIGQEKTLNIIRSALGKGRVPTAYLFTGPAGCGRMPAALALAAAMNCESEQGPCGACQSCRLHETFAHPDLHIIRPLPGKRWIVIEQIREQVLEKAYLMPMRGRVSIFILDDAHTMYPNAANAFLKTLEEPPETSRFVLIAPGRDSVLPTISSRCQELSFRPLGRKEMITLLGRHGVGRDRAHLLASMSRGSMERALEYHRGEIPEKLAEEFEPLSKLTDADWGTLFGLSQRWGKSRQEAMQVLEFMAQWFRDMLILAEGGGEEWVIHSSQLPVLRGEAARLGGYSLSMVLETIEDTREDLERNANVQLSLDNMLIRIRRQGLLKENRA